MWTQKTKPHCKKLHFKKQPHTHAGGLSTLPGERIATEMQQRTLCSTPRQDRVDYGTLAQALVLLFPDSWCVHSKPTSIIVSLVFLSSPQRSEDGGQPRRLQFQNFGANKLTDAELIAEMEMCFSSWSDTRKYVKKKPWRLYFVDWSSTECRRLQEHWQTAGRVETPRLHRQLKTSTR